MAGKQFADKDFMTQYSSYLKENALDPIARVIDLDGMTENAALHLPPQCDEPYFVMTSADGEKSIQLMTNGSYDGDQSDSGMGLRFQSFDGNAAYGNLSLKAVPTHGWDYILTLPNETGTLATRNYVDDELSGKANASHTHSTSNITSGTLTVSRGGTGKSSFTANRVVTTGTTTTGALQASAITTTELGYLDGVTSKIQTQLNGKANTNHDHQATLDLLGMISTNASANTSTVTNPVYFMVSDSDTSFRIMTGRLTVNSGNSPRTVSVTLPIGVKHLYPPVISESIAGGSSGTQYFNAVKAGRTSGYGPGGDFVRSFQIQVGLAEKCYVNWIALGDIR